MNKNFQKKVCFVKHLINVKIMKIKSFIAVYFTWSYCGSGTGIPRDGNARISIDITQRWWISTLSASLVHGVIEGSTKVCSSFSFVFLYWNFVTISWIYQNSFWSNKISSFPKMFWKKFLFFQRIWLMKNLRRWSLDIRWMIRWKTRQHFQLNLLKKYMHEIQYEIS